MMLTFMMVCECLQDLFFRGQKGPLSRSALAKHKVYQENAENVDQIRQAKEANQRKREQDQEDLNNRVAARVKIERDRRAHSGEVRAERHLRKVEQTMALKAQLIEQRWIMGQEKAAEMAKVGSPVTLPSNRERRDLRVQRLHEQMAFVARRLFER